MSASTDIWDDAAALVLIVGSTGAMQALEELLPAFAPAFALPVVVVLHQHRHGPSMLAQVLQPRCRLPVAMIEDKAPMLPGRVHVCPPAYHLLFERDGTFALSVDAPVHFAVPSLDVALDSAVATFGNKVVAVLLSSASTDGATGARAVNHAGGRCVCQAPETAVDATLSSAVMNGGDADVVASPRDIGTLLARLQP